MEKVFVLIGGFLFDFISDLIFFILHVTGSGSFPKPLSAKEEKEYCVSCECDVQIFHGLILVDEKNQLVELKGEERG